MVALALSFASLFLSLYLANINCRVVGCNLRGGGNKLAFVFPDFILGQLTSENSLSCGFIFD